MTRTRTPIKTGQVWTRNRDGQEIEILLAVTEADEHWRYRVVATRRSGRIYGWTLRSRYNLTKESTLC